MAKIRIRIWVKYNSQPLAGEAPSIFSATRVTARHLRAPMPATLIQINSSLGSPGHDVGGHACAR